MMNQIGSRGKVAYQQHFDGAIARLSCSDNGKWMVEFGRVIPLHALQNVVCRRPTSEAPCDNVQESAPWRLSGFTTIKKVS